MALTGITPAGPTRALIGTTVEARPRFPAVVMTLAFAGLALVGAGVAMQDPSPAMIGVAPLVFAGLLWLRQPKAVQVTFDDRGLRVLSDGSWIPYETIESATVRGTPWSAPTLRPLADPIVIEHARGLLVVPPRTSIPPQDFYRELVSRIPPRPPRPIPAALADYHSAQVAKFGAEKVTMIPTRKRVQPIGMGGWAILLWTMLLTAVAWGLLAGFGKDLFLAQDERETWGVAAMSLGISVLLLGLASIGIASSRKRKRIKMLGSCLILGPAGMAMVQDDMVGSLRWEEVMGVTHAAGAKAMLISVRGAKIIVHDVYERSLSDVAAMIKNNLG